MTTFNMLSSVKGVFGRRTIKNLLKEAGVAEHITETFVKGLDNDDVMAICKLVEVATDLVKEECVNTNRTFVKGVTWLSTLNRVPGYFAIIDKRRDLERDDNFRRTYMNLNGSGSKFVAILKLFATDSSVGNFCCMYAPWLLGEDSNEGEFIPNTYLIKYYTNEYNKLFN